MITFPSVSKTHPPLPCPDLVRSQTAKIKKTLILLVVSWISGTALQEIPCRSEPKDVVCARAVPQRQSREFKTEDAANEFASVLTEQKAQGVKVEKK